MKPHIILNCAMSLDGRISRKNERVVFSNELDKKRVYELRKSVDGIMVGINTVLIDNPKLTLGPVKDENPVRIIVDSKARIPLNSNVLNEDAHTIVAVSKSAEKSAINALVKKAEVLIGGEDQVDVVKLCDALYKMGIKRILLEGGGHLNKSMIEKNLVDEIYVTLAPVLLGDGVNLIEGVMQEKNLRLGSIQQIGSQVVLHYFCF